MNQLQIDKVLGAPVFLWNHMVHMKVLAIIQVLVTDWTLALLSLGQLSPAPGCQVGFCPPLPPIVLESGVVGGVRGADEPMASNFCPGEFPQRRIPTLILQGPLVVVTDRASPVLLRSPSS